MRWTHGKAIPFPCVSPTLTPAAAAGTTHEHRTSRADKQHGREGENMCVRVCVMCVCARAVCTQKSSLPFLCLFCSSLLFSFAALPCSRQCSPGSREREHSADVDLHRFAPSRLKHWHFPLSLSLSSSSLSLLPLFFLSLSLSRSLALSSAIRRNGVRRGLLPALRCRPEGQADADWKVSLFSSAVDLSLSLSSLSSLSPFLLLLSLSLSLSSFPPCRRHARLIA